MVKAIAESQLLRADEASPHTGSWPKADWRIANGVHHRDGRSCV